MFGKIKVLAPSLEVGKKAANEECRSGEMISLERKIEVFARMDCQRGEYTHNTHQEKKRRVG